MVLSLLCCIPLFPNIYFLFILGFQYATQNTNNISDFCTGMNKSTSCALLTRTSESGAKCVFTSCSERHDYICSDNITRILNGNSLNNSHIKRTVLFLHHTQTVTKIILSLSTLFLFFRNKNSASSNERVPDGNTSVYPWRSSSDSCVCINYSPVCEEQEEKIKVNNNYNYSDLRF